MSVNWTWSSTFIRCCYRIHAYDATVLTLHCRHVISSYQVYAILDEVFLAGEIEETSKDVVLARLEQLEKLE
jgi:hypothetical protein